LTSAKVPVTSGCFFTIPCCASHCAQLLSTGQSNFPGSRKAFADLTGRFPALAEQLLDGAGGLHKFVNVYRNDDDIRYLDQLDTKVADGDTISILPAVAGG